MVLSVTPMYRYALDQDDIIVWVDTWWLAFAKENNAAELTDATVIGHPIWEFISGEPTQRLYRELHQYVRETEGQIMVPFRCDSPTLQRHMEVTIISNAAGGLLYESRLIRVEPQPRARLLDAEEPRSNETLTMCSCCKRSLIEPFDWLDLEHIALRLRMFDRQDLPQLTYTICPDCGEHFEPMHCS